MLSYLQNIPAWINDMKPFRIGRAQYFVIARFQ
ncbi:hypothetical protein LC085_00800 [Bacillus tianshenii]|nr:hypothetical protein [Bacillus tianshenii]